eukprot:403333077
MLLSFTKALIQKQATISQRSVRLLKPTRNYNLYQKQNRRSFSFFNKSKLDHQKLDQKINDKFLLDENKSFLTQMISMFSNLFKMAFFNPVFSRLKSVFGMGASQQHYQAPWYSKIFGGQTNAQKSYFSRFRFFKNTKDAVVNRIVTVFGGLFFIYILAKAIPSSIRSFRLRKQELELEAKRMELEKLRLEVEQKRLLRRREDD